MPLKAESLLELLRDSIGRILIFSGLVFIVVGLLFMSKTGSIFSAMGYLIGVFFLVVGLVVHFELFRVNFRSKGGIGVFLMSVSPLLLVSALVSMLFAEPDWAHSYKLSPYRMGFQKNGVVIVMAPLVRLHAWLAPPLAVAGVCLFTLGVLLKLFDDVL